MTPERRYEALAAAEGVDLEQLADAILAEEGRVEVVRGPEVVTAAVRVPVPGTADSSAVLGHVALTTCTVELAGVRGDGCRTGRDLVGAVAAAVCDAEVERRGPLADAVADLAARSRNRQEARRAERARHVDATRVG